MWAVNPIYKARPLDAVAITIGDVIKLNFKVGATGWAHHQRVSSSAGKLVRVKPDCASLGGKHSIWLNRLSRTHRHPYIHTSVIPHQSRANSLTAGSGQKLVGCFAPANNEWEQNTARVHPPASTLYCLPAPEMRQNNKNHGQTPGKKWCLLYKVAGATFMRNSLVQIAR